MWSRLLQRIRALLDVTTYPSYGSCGGGDPGAIERDVQRRARERAARKAAEWPAPEGDAHDESLR